MKEQLLGSTARSSIKSFIKRPENNYEVKSLLKNLPPLVQSERK